MGHGLSHFGNPLSIDENFSRRDDAARADFEQARGMQNDRMRRVTPGWNSRQQQYRGKYDFHF